MAQTLAYSHHTLTGCQLGLDSTAEIMANTSDILRRITALSKREAKQRGNRRSGDNAHRLGFQKATLSGQQAVQRLQIGGSGIALMLLLVGLASIVNERTRLADAQAVPEATATVEPSEQPNATSDPLVDAGVVPDLPSRPDTSPVQEQAIVPENTDSPTRSNDAQNGNGNGSGSPSQTSAR